jgi:hypothetical protein
VRQARLLAGQQWNILHFLVDVFSSTLGCPAAPMSDCMGDMPDVYSGKH